METGQIGGVGLDVFENEPEVHPYLMQSERATLLPVGMHISETWSILTCLVHSIGGVASPGRYAMLTMNVLVDHSNSRISDMLRLLLDNLEKWLDTGIPNTPVNKPDPHA
jgi:lactate dehydrogenase-like 2-hydroxyacid dehydrogenase